MSSTIDVTKRIAKVTYNGVELPIPNVDSAFENGVKSEHDRFWDSFLSNTTDFSFRFAGRGWNDDTFAPTKDIAPIGTINQMFYNTVISNLREALVRNGVILDISKATNLAQLFCWSVSMTEIPSLVIGESVTTAPSMFDTCRELRTIQKLTFPNKQFNVSSMFAGCVKLENIEIGGVIATNELNFQWSTKLTHDSLMSIINALADKSADTSGTTWKITLGSENLAKLSEAEKLIMDTKGWFYV